MATETKRFEGCPQCGMATVDYEFHPHALCLLVEARGGDTIAARRDLAFVIECARKDDQWAKGRIDTFLRNVQRETTGASNGASASGGGADAA